MNECPNSNDGKHRYTYSVGGGVKSDFEPVQYGQSVEDTTYRRVEYSVMACTCGAVLKQRVQYQETV